MQLFKIPVAVLVFIVMTCRGEILVATARHNETTFSMVEDLVKIVTSCYGEQLHGIGIAGNLPDSLSRTLSTRHLIPVALIHGTKKLYDEQRSIEFIIQSQASISARLPIQHKLWVFIVEASSVTQLAETVIVNIISSIWQNVMASYFILDRSPGCVHSLEFLLASRNWGVLNSKVICYHHKSGRIIIASNLFTDKAPLPWQRDFRGNASHPFVSFNRKYEKDEAMCVNLDFDRTEDLGGFKIAVEGNSFGTNVRAAKTLREYRFWSENDRVLTTIFRAMNVTPVFTQNEDPNLFTSGVNVNRNMRSLHIRTVMSYPREQIEKVIVSHFGDRDSQRNTIRSVIHIVSEFGLSIVYAIVPFVFKFFVTQPLVSAFVNRIRVTCNIDFTNLPHNSSSRIYLTSLLLFAVTVQGMYQGHMARLLMTRTPSRSVDTMADVAELGYNMVYINYPDWVMIKDPGLQKHFVPVYSIFHCIEYVKRDSSAVCLWDRTPELLDLAQEFDLRVSSKFVSLTYMAFEIGPNWALEERLNVIIGRMAEADLLRHRDERYRPARFADSRLTNFQSKRFRKNNNFEKMNLRELSFAFVILGIGLACATVTFVAELAIGYECRAVRR